MKPGLYLLIMLITGCANIRISIVNNDLIYNHAEINEENFKDLKMIYDSNSIKPTKLIINSLGGDGLIGLEMGEWVHRNKISIEVSRHCLSSCANYVFPAGLKKILHKDALLGWHGGYFQNNLREQLVALYNGDRIGGDYQATVSLISPTTDKEHPCWSSEDIDIRELTHIEKQKHIQHDEKCLEYLKERESGFFKRIGVDSNLPYLGQTGEYRNRFSKEKYKFFYYSIEDMGRIGITNIQLADGVWTPENNSLFKMIYLVDIPKDQCVGWVER